MRTKFSGILTLLLAFVVQITFAQEKTISGTVTDDKGLPLPGVNIVIKGTATGTQSDFDGNYTVSTNRGAVLSFSYVGFSTKEVVVSDSDQVNVSLEQDAAQLEEVVVTAFGIQRNSKKLGYAVSTVKPDEVLENSEPDLIRSLSGKVPGVNVNLSTGVAGASNQINIRGVTTLGGASQPLIIVDGIAYDNSQVTSASQVTGGGGYESGLSSLDPNNIASINVLKSTAAAALYGSRATGGVIVITTKSGAAPGPQRNNKLAVNLSSGTYFENIANLPEYQNTYGNGVNFSYLNANGSWGPRFDSLETIPTWPNVLNAFPDLVGPTVPYEAQPDNVKNLFKTGVVLDNSVNLAYNGEDGNFNVTISDLAQEGYIPFNTYDRTSVSAGGNFKLSNGLRLGATLSYSETGQVGGFFGNNQFAGSASSFARTLWLGRTWDTSLPFENPVTGASVTPNNGWDHPLWSWKNDQITTETNRTVATVNLGFDFNDNISVAYRAGFNRYNLDRTQIRNIGSRAANGQGSLTQDLFVNEDLESTLLFNFDYQLSEDFGLTAIIGNNVLQNTTDRIWTRGTVFKLPNIFTLPNTLNLTKTLNGVALDDYTRSRNVGVFADIGFSFREFLFINATGRNDWSSSLPKNNQSYFYPSASISLIFTDALNLDSNVLTFGKLRAGYASVGNDADPEFLNRTFSSNNAFNGIATIGNQTFLADPEITPEFTDELELGVDLEFFNARAVVDFSWYKKTTTDLISPVSVPVTSGFIDLRTNIGEMENTGVEVGLTLIPVRNDNFKWELFTTFTKNENEVTELIEGLERIQLNGNLIAHAIVGEPFGVFFGSRFARDADGNFLINQSGGGIVQDLENGIVGDPNPDFKVGVINTFTYKNLSLRTQFDWKEGGDIQSNSINSILGRGVTKDTEDRERTFVIPGFYGDNSGVPLTDSAGNQIPNTTQIDTNELYFSPAGGNTFGINTTAEGSVYDGTVYRLREVNLTYSLPDKLLKNTPFGKISLSVLGNNLWYFAPNVPKYTNFDPEVTSFGSSRIQGIEVAAAPTSKRYGFKLNLSF